LAGAVCRGWVEGAQLNPMATEGAVEGLLNLYRAYTEADADLVEINPLILTPDGRVHALDAKVTLDDIYDVEAPEFGDVRWNMSALKAYRLALFSEQKAFGFYEEALDHVDQPEVKALFEELRDEEAEHVRMLVRIIANLPPSAEIEMEDEDQPMSRRLRHRTASLVGAHPVIVASTQSAAPLSTVTCWLDPWRRTTSPPFLRVTDRNAVTGITVWARPG